MSPDLVLILVFSELKGTTNYQMVFVNKTVGNLWVSDFASDLPAKNLCYDTFIYDLNDHILISLIDVVDSHQAAWVDAHKHIELVNGMQTYYSWFSSSNLVRSLCLRGL